MTLTFWNITLVILTYLASFYIGFIFGMINAAYKIAQRERMKEDEQQLLEVVKRVKNIVQEDKNTNE